MKKIIILPLIASLGLGHISASEESLNESMRKHELHCLLSNFNQAREYYESLSGRIAWVSGILHERIRVSHTSVSENNRELYSQTPETLNWREYYLARRIRNAHVACEHLNGSSSQEARQACAAQLEDFFEKFSQLEDVLRRITDNSMSKEKLEAFKKKNSELLDKIHFEGSAHTIPETK